MKVVLLIATLALSIPVHEYVHCIQIYATTGHVEQPEYGFKACGVGPHGFPSLGCTDRFPGYSPNGFIDGEGLAYIVQEAWVILSWAIILMTSRS